jgi:riboflavin-specific deaminase-like protein
VIGSASIVSEAIAVLGGTGGGVVVTVSWAQSTNGAIGGARGERVSLSGPESLLLTHRLRAAHGAILVGIQTVIADDPLLSVRLVEGPQPRPVVLDSHLRFPPAARLLARPDRKPWIFHADGSPEAERRLTERGARVFRVRRRSDGLDLREVLRALRSEGVSSLMVEGGARVLGTFLAERLAQQSVVTVCPTTLDGIPGPGIPDLDPRLQETHGGDAVIWGMIVGAEEPTR